MLRNGPLLGEGEKQGTIAHPQSVESSQQTLIPPKPNEMESILKLLLCTLLRRQGAAEAADLAVFIQERALRLAQ